MGGALSFFVYSPRSSDHLGSAGSGQPPRLLSSAGYLFTGADEEPQPRREGAQLQPRVGGLQARVSPSSTEEVKEKTSSSFRAGNLAQIIQTLAQQRWPNTFRLDCTVLGQPIGEVTRQRTWAAYLGRPMKQPERDTCALVACTVCVEAVHRLHGHIEAAFAAVPCNQLITACSRDRIWTPGKGANVGKVLTKIEEMGGVPATATTNSAPTPAPCVLPLRSWKVHAWDDGSVVAGRRFHDRVAELLDCHGPCIGVLWVCPWYQCFDAGRDDTLVYRGCGRSDDDRRQSKELYPGQVGWHAVVCFAYRFCGQAMHVLVMDNHSATGPQRWIDVEELHAIYTLCVL